MSTKRSLLLCKRHLENALMQMELKTSNTREKELEKIILAQRKEIKDLKSINKDLQEAYEKSQKIISIVSTVEKTSRELSTMLLCKKCSQPITKRKRRQWSKKPGNIPKAVSTSSLHKPIQLPTVKET